VKTLQSVQILDLAARLPILSKQGHTELIKLNKIRNRCSHDWTLHTYRVIRQTKNAQRTRKYRVEFNGNNLLNFKIFTEEFMPLYGGLYVELWCVYNGVRHGHKFTDSLLKGPAQ
jgi:hypothetical protein